MLNKQINHGKASRYEEALKPELMIVTFLLNADPKDWNGSKKPIHALEIGTL